MQITKQLTNEKSRRQAVKALNQWFSAPFKERWLKVNSMVNQLLWDFLPSLKGGHWSCWSSQRCEFGYRILLSSKQYTKQKQIFVVQSAVSAVSCPFYWFVVIEHSCGGLSSAWIGLFTRPLNWVIQHTPEVWVGPARPIPKTQPFLAPKNACFSVGL